MRGIIGNTESLALGGDLRRMERGGARKRTQCTWKEGMVQMDNKQTGLEGIERGESNQARITENLVGTEGREGGSTPGAEAGEHGCGGATGE